MIVLGIYLFLNVQGSIKYIDVILLYIFLFQIYAITKYSIKTNSISLGISAVAFSVAYLIPASFIIGTEYYISLYSRNILDNISLALLMLIAYIFILFFTYVRIVDKRPQKLSSSKLFLKENNLTQVAISCAVISLTGALILGYTSSNIEFSDRLTASAGTGYMLIFGFVGYLATALGIHLYLQGRIGIIFLGFLSIAPSAFFVILAYRGGAMYPLIAGVATVIYKKYGPTLLILVVIFSLPFSFEIDRISSALRVEAGYSGQLNLENVFYNYQEIRGNGLLPMTVSHVDLLETVIGDIDSGRLYYVYQHGFLPSLLNWIPRVLVDSKGLTTGPTLAATYFPDVMDRWGKHSSSLTTGPVVDMYVHFGLFGVALAACIHGIILGVIENIFSKKNLPLLYKSLLLVYIWLFAFSIFFDDFGGVVNKFALILIAGFFGILTKKIGQVVRPI